MLLIVFNFAAIIGLNQAKEWNAAGLAINVDANLRPCCMKVVVPMSWLSVDAELYRKSKQQQQYKGHECLSVPCTAAC